VRTKIKIIKKQNVRRVVLEQALVSVKTQVKAANKSRTKIWAKMKKIGGKVGRQMERWPLPTVGIVLAVMFGLAVISHALQTPKAEVVAEAAVKPVEVYQIGTVPTIKVQAKVEKTGVVTVVAQTGGIVNRLNVGEGQVVRSGQTLVNLATTYNGAVMGSLQRQIAQKSYENSRDNLDTQLELVAKRRDLANKTDENTDELRKISADSIDRTKDQLSLNEEILGDINSAIDAIGTPSNSTDAATLMGLKGQKAQMLAAIGGLKTGLDNLEYATADDKPPAQLSDLGREITQKGLDLEEKGYRLGVEIGELNLKLARIGEALYYPSSPVSGTVERVFVRPGQFVSPGTALVTIAGETDSMKAVALVSGNLARKVSRYDTSKLYLPGGSVDQVPQYVASEPTDGSLYAITWCQLKPFAGQVGDGDYITVEIPVGYQDSIASVPFVPLDSVYQTSSQAYVLVVDGEKAGSKQIKLGQVTGRYVEVSEGLSAGDQIIMDRNVLEGDKVRVN